MLKKTIRKSTFIKYNIVALTATSLDFIILVFLTEVLGTWYLFSAIIGTTLGGVFAFLLERKWTFEKTTGILTNQILRYLLIWAISFFLNITFLFLLVDIFHVQYIISRIIVAALISVVFNFLTHKHFIFK